MTLARGLRWLAIAAGALLVLMALAWWALPPLLKSQIESRGSAALGRELRVGELSWSPWALTLTLRDITVAGAGAGRAAPQLSVARLHLDVDASSLLRLAPVLQALEVDAPRLRVARLGEGRLDIDDVLAKLGADKPARPETEPARFALYNVQLRGGELQLDDRVMQRSHSVKKLALTLPFLSNLPADVGVKVEPRLAFVLDGAAVDLRGQALPFASDHATELQIKLDAFDLAQLWPYAPKDLPLQPSGGVLSVDLALRFSQPAGAAAQLGLRGTLTLEGLALANARKEPMLAWQRLSVQLADVRPLERHVALGLVRLEGASVDARRDARGQIDWASLGAAPAAQTAPAATKVTPPAPSAAPTTAPAPWHLSAQRIELAGAQLRWSDATLRPAATFGIDALEASADALRWPAVDAAPFALSTTLTAAGKPAAGLKLQGKASPQSAELTLDVQALQLAAAAPYLSAVLRPRVEGRAQAQATLQWASGAAPRLQAQLKSLKLDALRVLDADGAAVKLPANITSLSLDEATIDVLAQHAKLGSLRINKPVLALHRNAAGKLNVEQWAVPASASSASTPTTASPPWRAELRELLIDNGQVELTDAAVRPGQLQRTSLRSVHLSAQALAWPAAKNPARFQLAAALAAPAREGGSAAPDGRLSARGEFSLAGPSLRTALTLERLPVHVFEPYYAALLPLQLARAELNWRGDLRYDATAQGPKVQASGELLVADLELRAAPGSTQSASAADPELLSWQSLTLRPLTLVLAPAAKPRVDIGELALTNFYARLLVTEQGRFNLAQAPADTATAPSPSAAPPAAATSAARSELPIDLSITSTKLSGGRVDFTDRFVRPNYSAAMSELQGSVGRLATGTRDMAKVELRGRVAGTGLLDIRGSVNPTARPLALDISARASDIELSPLSPYSGKYAGYAIERGKLSVDVAYRVDADGKLEARNQITLNQLTFGDKVDSPVATKLPVRLALALLTDRNGVIDINLPVSGSINDPQFSVFGVVMKIIGNLLLKALTSPFAFLSGEGADELSVVEFVAGTAQVAPAGAAVIDKVARLLAERAALRLTVAGSADATREQQALKAAAFEARVVSEQRRERARAGADVSPQTALPLMSVDERTRIVRRLYGETSLPDKPRNLVGMQKELPVAQMQAMLVAAVPTSPDSARELALQRGLAVRDALMARGLPSERLFLGAPKLHLDAEAKADAPPWVPSVQLSLAAP